MRRQLDNLPLRKEPLQACEEFVRNVDRSGADAVRVFQRDPLPFGQVAGFLDAERGLDRLPRETSPTADGGIDINSEGTTVASRDTDSDQLEQVPAQGPPARAEDQIGQERREHRPRDMRLNLDRIEPMAESQPGHPLFRVLKGIREQHADLHGSSVSVLLPLKPYSRLDYESNGASPNRQA
jgi:hypothetical protein